MRKMGKICDHCNYEINDDEVHFQMTNESDEGNYCEVRYKWKRSREI